MPKSLTTPIKLWVYQHIILLLVTLVFLVVVLALVRQMKTVCVSITGSSTPLFMVGIQEVRDMPIIILLRWVVVRPLTVILMKGLAAVQSIVFMVVMPKGAVRI